MRTQKNILLIIILLLLSAMMVGQTPAPPESGFDRNTNKWRFIRPQLFQDTAWHTFPVYGVSDTAANSFVILGTLTDSLIGVKAQLRGDISDSIALIPSPDLSVYVQKWQTWDSVFRATDTSFFDAPVIIGAVASPDGEFHANVPNFIIQSDYFQLTATDNIFSTGSYFNPFNAPAWSHHYDNGTERGYINKVSTGDGDGNETLFQTASTPSGTYFEIYSWDFAGGDFSDVSITPSQSTFNLLNPSFTNPLTVPAALENTHAVNLGQVVDSITSLSVSVQQMVDSINSIAVVKDGSAIFNIQTITSNATTTAIDYTTLVDTEAGDVTYTLPTPSNAPAGRILIVKKISGMNNVTVTDGTYSDTFSILGQSRTYQSNGTTWHIISEYKPE